MTNNKQDCIVPSEPLILKGTMETNVGSYRRANGATTRERSLRSYSRPVKNSRSPMFYEKERDRSWSSSPRNGSHRSHDGEDEHMDNHHHQRSTYSHMQRESSRDAGLYARRSTKENRVLGVFNIPRDASKQDLEPLFSRYGTVEKITVVQRLGARHSHFAFVRLRRLQDAVDAQGELNATTFMGRKIRVDFSLTDRPHSRTPGQYMGYVTRRRRSPQHQRRRYARYGGRSPSSRNSRRYRSRSPPRRRYRSRRYRHRRGRSYSYSRNHSHSRSRRRHH
ncbi:transformer 2 beta [Dispira simplex]|nr:transformer 2 beta [Dispira simplex]